MKTLRKGSKCPEVIILQTKLGITADGIFGAETEIAVKKFQKAHDLTVDGIAGAKTWSCLGFDTRDAVRDTRTINMIILHYAATPVDKDFSVESLENSHKVRKFSSYTKNGRIWHIGYHYYIRKDGTVIACRPENIRGCHASGYNAHSIGICYEGGCPVSATKNWQNIGLDTRTPAQKAAILKLLKDLRKRYPNAPVHGHNEFANKPCPGFNAREEYKDI